MRTKIGDTLVEVALAIGIFSMVAIVIVSVISASTSNAQTALEVTISREDLDAQAEALRFIHDSYMNANRSEDKSNNKYHDLWYAIIDKAMDEDEALDSKYAPKYELDFTPDSCSDLYDNSSSGVLSKDAGWNPFIINIRKLGGTDPRDILITNGTGPKGPGVFYEATTFPRIFYGISGDVGKASSDDSFLNQITDDDNNIRDDDNIQRAEGIYIVATKGKHDIVIIGDDNSQNKTEPKYAYYDFYIRSCWFPPSAKRPSTISTVIRLYDPDAICYGSDLECK